MSPRLKKLLIACHPDRHGGDHSHMEKVFAASRRRSVAGIKPGDRRCPYPNCGVAINATSKACGIHWRKLTRPLLAAVCLLASVLCHPATAAEFSAPPVSLPPYLNPRQARLTQALRALTHPPSNGVVTLEWNNGEPPQTTISNLTTGASIAVGTNQIATLGRQRVGTNVFVALNAAGQSNLVTNAVAADSNRLGFTPWIYRATWPGAAGVLQSSSNAVLWSDLQPIATGAVVLITNDAPLKLFRVRILNSTTNQP